MLVCRPVSLARKAAGSLLWATLASGVSRIVTIGSTFALTRYLTPEVQGEVNLAFVLVATLGATSALGVSQYVAASRDHGPEVCFHGAVLVLVTGLLVMVAAVAGGPAASRLLGAPGMVEHVPGLAIAHLVERCGWVPRSVLVRQMRFRVLGLRVALSEIAFAVSSVAFAALGRGGESIVLGNLVRSVIGLAFLFVVVDRREWLSPHRISREVLRRMLRFGLPLSASWLFRVGATTWDNSFMGYRFGEGAVGIYNQAYRLAELPATSVGDQCNDVLVPAFAKAEGREAKRRGFLRAASLATFVVAPMALGLGAVSGTLVEVFYPPEYAGVAPFLLVLAPLGLTRMLTALAGAFLQVAGRTRVFAAVDLALAVLVLGLMSVLARWGEVAACAGVLLAFLVNLVLILRCLRPDGVTIGDVGAAVARPLLAAVVMAGAVFSARGGLAGAGVPGAARLLVEVAGGAAVYTGMCFAIAPRVVSDFVGLARGVVARRRAAPAA